MNATIVDLRYRMKDVLRALERIEEVSILYHGKGVISAPVTQQGGKVSEHPFYNMHQEAESVDEQMEGLRGGRHRDL